MDDTVSMDDIDCLIGRKGATGLDPMGLKGFSGSDRAIERRGATGSERAIGRKGTTGLECTGRRGTRGLAGAVAGPRGVPRRA